MKCVTVGSSFVQPTYKAELEVINLLVIRLACSLRNCVQSVYFRHVVFGKNVCLIIQIIKIGQGVRVLRRLHYLKEGKLHADSG